MNLNDIHQAQKDLLDESQEYFGAFFEWEKQAQEEFIDLTHGSDEGED